MSLDYTHCLSGLRTRRSASACFRAAAHTRTASAARSIVRGFVSGTVIIAAALHAEWPCARAQPASTATPPARIVDIALVRDGLAELVKARIDAQQFGEAIALLEQGVKAATDPANGEQAAACSMLELLAQLHDYSGDHGKALEASLLEFRIAAGLEEATFEQKTNVFRSCEARLMRQGDMLRARTLCDVFLQSCREDPAAKGPQGSLFIARALVQAASLCVQVGLNAEADAYLREFWDIVEKTARDDNPTVAVMLMALGNPANLLQTRVHLAKSDLPRARRLAEQNLDSTREHGGSDDEVAAALMLVAEACRAQGDYDAALESLIEAGQMIKGRADGRPNLGNADVHTGEELSALQRTSLAVADTLLQAGKPESARSFYMRALDYSRRRIGENVAAELDVLFGVGRCEMAQGDYAEAFDAFDIARRPFHDAVVRAAFSLGSGEQAGLIAQIHAVIVDATETATRSADDPAAAAWGEEWLLNFKGIATAAQIRQQRFAKTRVGDSNANDLFRLGAIRRQLSSVTLGRVTGDEERAIAASTKELLHEESLLVRRLALDRGLAAGVESLRTIAELRQNIPADAILVDMIRLDSSATPLAGEKPPDRYVAFIVPPAGDRTVRIVDLGVATAVDAAVQRYRTAIDAGRVGFRRGQATAEEELKVAAAPLASQVLQPIVDAAGAASEIIVCPDGDLWLVPWAALPLADGAYAIETFVIRTVTTGRDLLPLPSDVPAATGDMVVVADPAFDAKVANPTEGSASDSRAASPHARDVVRIFKRLEGTRSEALATQSTIARLSGVKPRMLLGPDATETNLRRAAVRPRTLVVATHGFFLDDQKLNRNASAVSLSGSPSRGLSQSVAISGEPLEDPLLRCGLALAGANGGMKNADGDDGILTGAEIVGLDLLGTDLVVLSACETGVGKVQNGEGVAGLRQAFQIAGAKSVVATLWQVPDAESGQIMQSFYANVAQGQTPSKALREAQLAFIKARREDRAAGEAAHPYLWAAYGVTGR